MEKGDGLNEIEINYLSDALSSKPKASLTVIYVLFWSRPQSTLIICRDLHLAQHDYLRDVHLPRSYRQSFS